MRLSLSLLGILFLSTAMTIIERVRNAAFFHAQERQMFSGLRYDSMALSHEWLGLPGETELLV